VIEQIRYLPGYEIVLFDTPPAVNLSDALLLSEQLDGLVFVVGMHRADPALPTQALRSFSSSGVDVIGLITNQLARAIGSFQIDYVQGYCGGCNPQSSEPASAQRGASKQLNWIDGHN
jgi:hypothetical protein